MEDKKGATVRLQKIQAVKFRRFLRHIILNYEFLTAQDDKTRKSTRFRLEQVLLIASFNLVMSG